jgi:hypothetical protein
MADFYPLVVKAVAGLAPDASGERQALYNRMREALTAALRTSDPPFTEFQIMRERLALEGAVSRVEGEVAQRDRESLVPLSDDSAVDADDFALGVEIQFLSIAGSATGRLNQVWHCGWR